MRTTTWLSAIFLFTSLAACNSSPATPAADLASPADLAPHVEHDLATSPDLAVVADMATSADMARTPADLAQLQDLAGLNEPCTAGGATVGMLLCCNATGDFPNLCAIGACGCAPNSSHMVRVCVCPGQKCWNGTTCQ